MKSYNEWDSLKSVIVGVADYAQIPKLDKSLRAINYAHLQDTSNIKIGQYPQQVIDEANEDLEILCNFLKSCNIEVLRPDRIPTAYYNYCPRDTSIIYGDIAIAAPMSLSLRNNEYLAYNKYLRNVHVVPNYVDDDIINELCIGNKNILALNEMYPKFDAANIIRANDDLLYLVSNTGNKIGATYLQELLGPSVKVHTLENVYSYIHIDSTIAFLREGLMLLNPSRISSLDVLPKPFRNWDYIMCPEPVDIGFYPGYCNASTWINVNLLSINPNLVVLEENQRNLQIELEKRGIECAMLPMRHARTLGGCFHCVTLDLERGHK